MAIQTRRYRETKQVTLNASGYGQTFVSPNRPGIRYNVQRTSTQGNSTLEPQFRVYDGTVEGAFISGSYTGNMDSDDSIGLEVWSGERVTVEWIGGTAGAVMVATFYGEELSGVENGV